MSATTANDKFAMVIFEDGFETSPDDTAIAVGLVKDSELREDINKILATISNDERIRIMDEAIKNQPVSE